MRFEGAVLHEVGGPVVVQTIEAAPLQPNDVLVRIHASGLCHTDLEVIRGEQPFPPPILLGHEGAGVVEAVGSAVSAVQPGEHVACAHSASCGQCFHCYNGQPLLCETFSRSGPKGLLMDGTSRLKVDGQVLHHFMMASSHAEYCVVPEMAAVPIPKEMPMDRACLIGCGVMTGYGAVFRVAEVKPGTTIAVFGCGAVGLNVLQAARLANAEIIVGVDLSEKKLKLAKRFGATHTVNPGQHDPVDLIRSLTKGRGTDCTIEAAGNFHSVGMMALQQALDSARVGGTVVILGKTHPDTRVALRFGSLLGDKRIIRSWYGGARPRLDFPWLAKAYLEGKFMMDNLITRHIGLKDISSGFEYMEKEDQNLDESSCIRIVLDLI